MNHHDNLQRGYNNSGDSAFTLIELLTVIVIIGTLAALLFPLAKRATEVAKSAKCISNLRQLGAETMSYVAEKGFYPPMISQTTNPTNGAIGNSGDDFYSIINKSQSKGCTICPSAKFTGYDATGRPKEGYGGNPSILINYQNNNPSLVRPGQIARPSEVALLTDGCQNPANGYALGFFAWWGNGQAITGDPSKAETPLTTAQVGLVYSPPLSMLPLRHNGRANILFCDGHITSVGAIGDLKQKNLYWNY
jgi:prepilin-type processing-associated H-X9-DG protein/prepilin-type N-terminal cleavage/methylation domain-containing protein